jgi:hypothetical protein
MEQYLDRMQKCFESEIEKVLTPPYDLKLLLKVYSNATSVLNDAETRYPFFSQFVKSPNIESFIEFIISNHPLNEGAFSQLMCSLRSGLIKANLPKYYELIMRNMFEDKYTISIIIRNDFLYNFEAVIKNKEILETIYQIDPDVIIHHISHISHLRCTQLGSALKNNRDALTDLVKFYLGKNLLDHVHDLFIAIFINGLNEVLFDFNLLPIELLEKITTTLLDNIDMRGNKPVSEDHKYDGRNDMSPIRIPNNMVDIVEVMIRKIKGRRNDKCELIRLVIYPKFLLGDHHNDVMILIHRIYDPYCPEKNTFLQKEYRHSLKYFIDEVEEIYRKDPDINVSDIISYLTDKKMIELGENLPKTKEYQDAKERFTSLNY